MTSDFLFTNYEIYKLKVDQPTLFNCIILTMLIIFAGISFVKQKSVFLDEKQTLQLKGIAILLVVVGHLWVHVSANIATPILGDYAVSLFLMLSGFGLCRSLDNGKMISIAFLRKRVSRVMIPYWIATFIILIVDYILIDRFYNISNILSTLAGINFTKEAKQIDYTRWFITLLLTYYVIFFITEYYFNKVKALFCIWCFCIFLIILRLIKVYPLGTIDQIIAFPIGCLIAFTHPFLLQYFSYKVNYYKIFLLVIMLVILFTLPLFSIEQEKIQKTMKFFLLGVGGIKGILSCFLLIIIIGSFGQTGYISRFLKFVGAISYEIFLIHGPLLIKYNPIFNYFPNDQIVFSFLILLLIIIILASGFHRIVNFLSVKF